MHQYDLEMPAALCAGAITPSGFSRKYLPGRPSGGQRMENKMRKVTPLERS
jgi:hypothetical protein